MVGRAAYGQPWLLAQIGRYLKGHAAAPVPSPEERGELVLEHYEAMLSYYGVEKGLRMARKHLSWYASGLRGANGFRESVNRETEPRQVRQAIRALFDVEAQALAA